MHNNIDFSARLRKGGLFQIPNPYNDHRPEKEEWHLKAEKLAKKINETRKMIDEMMKEYKDNVILKRNNNEENGKQLNGGSS